MAPLRVHLAHSSLPENHEVSSPSSAHFRKYTSFNLYICERKTSFYPKASVMIKWEKEDEQKIRSLYLESLKLKAPLFSSQERLNEIPFFLNATHSPLA
jgi:hypothetical protein